MADVTIKRGDRLPTLARQFLTDGAATNLTGATVVFNMWNASSGTQVITDGACTVTAAATGNVEYAWTATDATLDAGFYLASFTATFTSPTRALTAPNNGMISIQIVAATASAWSYTGDPAARAIDKVRFLLGDTDSNNPLVMDAEISFLLAQWNNDAYIAAAQACNSLAAKFASKSDYSRSVGDLSISTQYGQQADRYASLGAQLRAQAATNAPPSPTYYATANGDVGHASKFYIDMDANLE
jgi:hypothetical protein